MSASRNTVLVDVTSPSLHRRRRRHIIVLHHLLIVILVFVVEKFVGEDDRDAFVGAAQFVGGGALCVLCVSQTTLVTIVKDAEDEEEHSE